MNNRRIIKIAVKEAIGVDPTIHIYDCPDYVCNVEEAWDFVKSDYSSNDMIVEIYIGYEPR